MKSFVLNLLAIILGSIGLSAQNSASLHGRIVSKDKKPVIGSIVLIRENKLLSESDENGYYQFKHLNKGSYTLIVSYFKQSKVIKKIFLNEDEQKEVNFQLEDNAEELAEVVVNAQRGLNDKTPNVGKSNIIARDLPQLTQTIEKSILDRQLILKMSEVLQNLSGIYIMGNTGGFQEEIASRGYALNSNNTFKNGSRFNNSVSPELSSVEKIEFLKGGAAILYGNVSPGGVMNIITKKPKFEKGGELSVRTGSYHFYKPSIDMYGAIGNSKTLAYRMSTSYENGNSFRDKVSSTRIYINPSLLLKINERTNILIEGDLLKETRTADFGIGAINYTIPSVSRSNFIGINWGYNKVEQTNFTITLTHQFNKKWKGIALYGTQSYEQELFSAARLSSVNVATDGTWIRGLQKSATLEKYQIGQFDITGQFETGKMTHQMLIGADLDAYRTTAFAFNTTLFNNQLSNNSLKNKNIYDTINIYKPTQKRNDIPDLTLARVTTSPINRYGIYIQDLLSLSKQIKLLVGIRFSQQSNKKATVDTIGKNIGWIEDYMSKAWSPKIGLVYQPIKSISVFTSYTNNFSPNSGTDINNTPLAPSIINQYEIGLKNDFLQGKLSANFTYYKIINSNFVQTVIPVPANNPLARELAGEVTSDGLEIDIMTKPIKGFSVIAGYSYNDSRYTKSNIYTANDRLRYNPRNTANASLYYTFNEKSMLRGINWGIGCYFVGERVAGRNTSILNPNYKLMSVPDYTLIDLSAGYNYANFQLRLKISNLMNVLSYNLHDDNSVNPIAPRQIAITFTQKL